MKGMQGIAVTVSATIVLCGLSACGKKKEEIGIQSFNSHPAVTIPTGQDLYNQGAASVANAEAARVAQYSKADPSVPLGQYQELTANGDIPCLYYAISGQPVDYDSVAKMMSMEYRSTGDVFKKQSMLDKLKPQIDAKIAAFKTNHYVKVQYQIPLGHYDLSKKVFPLISRPSIASYDNVYQYDVTNTDAFDEIPVADQAVAQKIEAAISGGSPILQGVLYLYAQGVNPNHQAPYTVEVQAVELDAFMSDHTAVGTIKAHQ